VIGIMPTGKVKWFDADKGFGFLAQEGGADVHVRSSALPAGMTALKPGQKVEFDVADGRRGPQALRVTVVDAPPSIVAATRRPAEELHGLVDDMIKLLESKALPELRRGRYPEKAIAGRIADVMRAVAAEFDA
jgi:cold shock protein